MRIECSVKHKAVAILINKEEVFSLSVLKWNIFVSNTMVMGWYSKKQYIIWNIQNILKSTFSSLFYAINTLKNRTTFEYKVHALKTIHFLVITWNSSQQKAQSSLQSGSWWRVPKVSVKPYAVSTHHFTGTGTIISKPVLSKSMR